MTTTIGKIGFWIGLLLGVLIWLMPPFAGLTQTAQATLALATVMVMWWMTESIPISATALLPLVLIPILGIGTMMQASSPYANPVIFLFLGGFLLATALERCGLHKRIAYFIVSLIGMSPNRLILGFLIASAVLSMWISNTATALMMLPIALSVGSIGSQYGNTDKAIAALLLAVAFGSNLGGVGTLIGTPPNAIMVGYLQQNHDIQIGFAEWMKIGVPIILVMLPIVYFVLKGTMGFTAKMDEEAIAKEVHYQRSNLGSWSAAEVRVTLLFVIAAIGWIFQPYIAPFIPGISDAGVSIFVGLLLFIVSDNKDGKLLDWSDAERIPWGVLVLFGGGLSLADAIQRTDLAVWLGDSMSGLAILPLPAIILVVSLMIIFFSEVTSNSATAAAVLPVMGALAVSLGYDPTVLVIPATLAATTAFMLPVGTPPNAIVFSSGKVRQIDMIRTGFWLNIASAIVITLMMMLFM
jgi:solute carrier family 13 (sodium-dependent dicarboxylate transporter), member 2/3/5